MIVHHHLGSFAQRGLHSTELVENLQVGVSVFGYGLDRSDVSFYPGQLLGNFGAPGMFMVKLQGFSGTSIQSRPAFFKSVR